MKLSDPLTKDELANLQRAIGGGGSLGLFRIGEGEEKGMCMSLLGKLLVEYLMLKAGRE